MASAKGTLRTCKKGHQYYKSSDCPVCPICAAEEKPEEEILAVVGAPNRAAVAFDAILPRHAVPMEFKLANHGYFTSELTMRG